MTLIEAVQSAQARLEAAQVAFGHGTTNAWDEAAWLVLWRLNLPLDALDQNAQLDLTQAQQQAIDQLVQRRIATRKPAAYLTGEAWLHGVPFDVDERVIVPRSLIAEPLLDGTLDAWVQPGPLQVLDLCTGTGSLAILAAMAWPEATVDAADISAPALAVAQKNLLRHGMSERIKLIESDGLMALGARAYDVILCNPPYVNTASMASLPAEFLAEPALALAGGLDGMDFVRNLIEQAATYLKPRGVLVLEVGHEHEHFERAFGDLDPIWLETSGGDTSVLLCTREDLLIFETPRNAP